MSELTGFALFCEDIREEKKGSSTFVGVFPSGITVDEFPVDFGLVWIFSRVIVPVDWDKGPIDCVLVNTDGQETVVGEIQQDFLSQLRSGKARQDNALSLTLTTNAELEFAQSGNVFVIMRYGSTDVTIGRLRVVQRTPKTHTD
jgi:hypothetical protein